MHENEKVNHFGNSADWYYVHGICLNTGYHAGVTVNASYTAFAHVKGKNIMDQDCTNRDYTVKNVSLLTPLQRKKRGL